MSAIAGRAMREIQQHGLIIFEDRPLVLPAILAAASVMFAVGLAYHIDELLSGDKEAIGIGIGFLFSGFGAVLLFRRDRFVFDAGENRVRWRKWSLARSSSGELHFSDILDVAVESTSGADGGGTYRVALRTKDGTIPLTEAYAGGADRWRPTVARIRKILGHASKRPADVDMDSLMDQGRKIDAIRQLRETEGLSLTQAKAKVESVDTRVD